MNNTSIFLYLVPELIIASIACVILLHGVWFPKQQKMSYFLAQFGVLFALMMALYLKPNHALSFFHGQFVVDPIAYILKIVILIATFLVFVYGENYLYERDIPIAEFYTLSLLSLFGMMILVSTTNLITLYLALEIFSLPIYALVALRRKYVMGIEAGMKYFIAGAFASVFFLYGLSLVFGATGHINIPQIVIAGFQKNYIHPMWLTLGVVFIISSVAFKLGAAPFHMWVPDVYQGAPSHVTLFISGAPKIAAFALLIRFMLFAFPGFSFQWHELLLVIAVLSMAIGNIFAIAQDNLKRLLAYSSIAHMGYVLLAFSIATPQGEEAALFYLLSYLFMTLGAFGLLVILSSKGHEVEHINDIAGLNSRNPWMAFVMLLLMFSMAGVPPIIGFIAKMRILEALVQSHLVSLAILALLFSVIGAYYYLRVVMVMYFQSSNKALPLISSGMTQSIVMGINGLAVLVVGIYPTPLFMLCQWVLSSHM